MGTSTINKSTILDKKYIKTLTTQTPFQNLQPSQTEIHQIYFHSLEHHQIMLQKIKSKKKYDSPFIIKILDSHTVESQNFCSTLIKTYIVLEKPRTLEQEIQRRINLEIGFSEAELWTLIYSCILGGSYFVKNNVGLVRLTANKIYIDVKGNIKINDPEFSQGSAFLNIVSQSSFIYSIYQIALQLQNVKQTPFSEDLLNLMTNMSHKHLDLSQVIDYIQKNYLINNNQDKKLWLSTFSKQQKTSRSKSKKIRVISQRKHSNLSNKSREPRQTTTSALTSYDSLASYQCSNQNKQNSSENKNNNGQKNLQLLTLTLKSLPSNIQLNRNNIKTESHMFQKKALCGQRKKIQEKIQQPMPQSQLECQEFERKEEKKQGLGWSGYSHIVSESSLNSSQLVNIISYQVDQQTSVRQICHEKSQYIIRLLNRCKGTVYTVKN